MKTPIIKLLIAPSHGFHHVHSTLLKGGMVFIKLRPALYILQLLLKITALATVGFDTVLVRFHLLLVIRAL